MTYRDPDVTHAQNTYAAASPITDGKLVIAWFGSAGLVAYDRNGRELWRRDLGRQKHVWGYASSPVLHGDSLFLSFGPGDRAFLLALDKNTGKTLWQVGAPKGVGTAGGSWTAADMYGSWSTPIIIHAAGRDELVLTWPRKVFAFDPVTGKVLWTCDGLGDQIYPSPIFVPQGDGGIVIAPSGFGDSIMAIKAGGNGDVTSTHRLWRNPKTRGTIPSGVISGNYLFVVDNNGIAECLELMTGKNVWTSRLRGSGDDNGMWSSLVLNEGKIYAMNKSAEVFLFKPGPQFELLGSNSLSEETNSSLVISNGEIFIRTFNSLWCIGKITH